MDIESLEVEAAVTTDLAARARQFAEVRAAPLGGLSRLDADYVEEKIEQGVAGVLLNLRQWAMALELELAPLYADIRAGEDELEFRKTEAQPGDFLFGIFGRIWNWYFRVWEGIRASEAQWREARTKLERNHHVRLVDGIMSVGIRPPVAERYAALLRREMALL